MASRPIQHLQSVVNVPKIEPVNLAPLMTVPIGEHFKVTPTGLEIHGDPSFEICTSFCEVLRTFERSIQFCIGDFANYMEDRFGEQASQVICAETGWSRETLRNYRWVSEKLAPEDRMIDRGLSFKHHMVVAALPPVQQRKWLDKAIGDGDGEPWSVSRLTIALKEGADIPVSSWRMMLVCSSERQRAKIAKYAELEGATVKMYDDRKGEK